MNQTRLALAVNAGTTDEALRLMERRADEVDLFELRLDLMDRYDLPRLLEGRTRPVIVTNRAQWEGGRCTLEEDERLAVLAEAAALGAEHVDVELAAVERAGGFDAAASRLILSQHDFDGMLDMPSAYARVQTAAAACSGIGIVAKLVGAARDGLDALMPLATLKGWQEAEVYGIALAMGEAGLVTRILAARYGAYLTFVCSDDQAATAPGQISAQAMRDVFHFDDISAATAVYGCFTDGARDDDALGRANRRLRDAGFDAVCVPLVSKKAEAFREGASALGFVDFCRTEDAEAPLELPELEALVERVVAEQR